MGLLDKLKPQPRWKHADPSIRLEALRELDDPIELSALAESDPDIRVRRAAILRSSDAAVLGRIAASDSDADTRDRAAERLLALATGADDEETAVQAVAGLTDPRRLSTIAKSDAPESVRAAALVRTTDERALSAIARYAKHESTARAALDRLSDPAEVLEVALHGDHRDVALAAFARAIAGGVDLAQLKAIESRSQQKAVAKRARTMIQEIEDAEAARRAAEDERRRRQDQLCEQVERLSAAPSPAEARATLASLGEQWQALEVTDEAANERFTAGATAAQAAIAQREREAEEALERARLYAEAVATREALCARVETLEGDDVLEQLRPIEEEWRSLQPLVGEGPEAERLAQRFAQAVAACRKRHEMRSVLAERRDSLAALVAEAEALLSNPDAGSAATRWAALSREARSLTATLAEASRPDAELEARLTAVGAAFAAREQAARDALAQAQQSAIAHVNRLAERARRASEAESITLREGDRLIRDIVTGLDEASRVPSTREIDDAVVRLRELQEKVAPRVRELREMDEWRRFANAQRQEQLIAMAEAIVASIKADQEAGRDTDLPATARALRELHGQWQDVAEAPRNVAQRLWERFRFATDFIRSRCEVYFAKQREDREESLRRKLAIVEEAESLAQSTDWARVAQRYQELDQAWQETGTVARDSGRELSHRFRTARNTFFTRRREDMAARKRVWAENLARKESLCARAETLAESMDWEAASAEMKRLQTEWKTIGPVRRQQSELVWVRFRAAADRFFERYHNRHQIALNSKLAEREAQVVEIESLALSDDGLDPGSLVERVQQLRSTWNRSVPIPTAEMKALADRWQSAFARIVERHTDAFKGTDLDPSLIRQKLEKLVAKVESYLAGAEERTAGLSQTELLAARLRSALASNAMGGRGGDEAKWRAAADAVRDAQSAWHRLAPIAPAEAHGLEGRFREACRRVNDLARRHAPSHGSHRDRDRGQGGGRSGGHPRPTTRTTAAAV
jgi:hypothetical protein